MISQKLLLRQARYSKTQSVQHFKYSSGAVLLFPRPNEFSSLRVCWQRDVSRAICSSPPLCALSLWQSHFSNTRTLILICRHSSPLLPAKPDNCTSMYVRARTQALITAHCGGRGASLNSPRIGEKQGLVVRERMLICQCRTVQSRPPGGGGWKFLKVRGE